ncbi:LemA family protein [Alphaproteobacteria bacterium LMG 31809]|uniref:LemA family protein n=2 Tax=Govanella unica TaxID=2975056 RepID=A0A9X3TWM4_9PROT|nr:LemA family protein [Govania unica]MDA5193296.1 LemA family protein [Govania unica]
MRNKLLGLLAVPVLAVSLTGCGVNEVPTAEEAAKAKWADVQSAYQRRADLIPNLVKVAERYAQQEHDVLTEVTAARAKATSIQLNANDLNDPAKMAQFAEAQGQLGSSIGRLLVTMEAYPNLKSDQVFINLQSQLEGTENRINIARRDYNEAVRQYNTTIRTFPAMVAAKVIYNAKPMTPFEAKAGAENAPTVDFGKR